MFLAISNIGWSSEEEPKVLGKLSEMGVNGIELAPTKWWPNWEHITPQSIAAKKAEMRSFGFSIPAFQSLLFNKPDLQIFDPLSYPRMIEHFKVLADLAAALETKVLVFGSPKNRLRKELSFSEAKKIAGEVFERLAEICGNNGVFLGIEHNPVEYTCDFLTNPQDVKDFVTEVNHPFLKWHFDMGGIKLISGSVQKTLQDCSVPVHAHLSSPFLKPLLGEEGSLKETLSSLSENQYEGWVSIEMARPDDLNLVYESVALVQNYRALM